MDKYKILMMKYGVYDFDFQILVISTPKLGLF